MLLSPKLLILETPHIVQVAGKMSHNCARHPDWASKAKWISSQMKSTGAQSISERSFLHTQALPHYAEVIKKCNVSIFLLPAKHQLKVLISPSKYLGLDSASHGWIL